MTTLTRNDCTRDDVKVPCPNAIALGYGQRHCKRGFWVMYEVGDHKFVGRSVGRVTCEGVTYIEVVQASIDFSSAFIRWVKPEQVCSVRKSPPRRVFDFFASTDGWDRDLVFKALEHGVSDSRDQQEA